MPAAKLLSPHAGEHGFTLAETVLAGALVAILSLAMVALFQIIFNNSRSTNTTFTRDTLMLNIRKAAADLNTLRGSLHQPENAALLACVCGSAGGCASGVSQPVSLYGPGAVAPQPNINFYNLDGSPCVSSDPSCIFQTQTTFVAQCLPALPSANPTPPANCTAPAELIAVMFSVQANPSNPRADLNFRVLSGAAYTQVSAIAPAGSGVCP